jgi:hypothetical protein
VEHEMELSSDGGNGATRFNEMKLRAEIPSRSTPRNFQTGSKPTIKMSSRWSSW